MFINLHKELPKDTDIQCYFNINPKGESSYVYCKVIYEPITEGLLYEDYEIRNVDLQEKDCSRKISANSASILRYDLQNINKNFQCLPGTEKDKDERKVKKEAVSFRSILRSASEKSMTFSYNDMDPLESKRPVRNYPRHINDLSTQIYYVPIAVCIETRIPYVDQASNLLNALISVIFKNDKNYMNDIQNLIFSYAEFCSHLLTLTHITVPPPLTNLSIPIANTEIFLQESWISEFPSKGDISIGHLFFFMSIDHVIMIWSLFLLEKNIIFHVSEPNVFFHVTKAFTELMFPLTWVFPKGLVSNPELLNVPTPYCFGVLESKFPTVEQLIDKLEELDEECIDCVIIKINEGQPAIHSKLLEYTSYHNEKELNKKLTDCLAKFGLNSGEKVPKEYIHHKELWYQVQLIFRKEVEELLNSFKVTIQERPEILGSSCSFAKLEIKKGLSTSYNSEEFLEVLKEKQTVASFYDEHLIGIQGNFARKQAIDSYNEGLPPIEPLNITVCSNSPLILYRLDKLVEQQTFKQKKEQDNVFPMKSFDWKEEISRILGRETNSRLRSSEVNTQSPLNNSPESKAKYEEEMDKEITIIMEVTNEESKGPPKKSNKIENRFYGSKGILSFLQQFMKPENEPAHKSMLIEEVRNVEEYFKHSLVQTRANTGNSSNLSSSIKEDAAVCIFNAPHNESSFADNSPVPVVSELVGSLIDVKYFAKMNSFTCRERLLFNFTSSSCFQFELVLGYFYYKQDSASPLILKKFIEAFKHIHKGGKYHIYFPAMMLKLLIKKLTLEELKEIPTDSLELKEIVNEIRDHKERIAVLENKKKLKEEQKRSAARKVICLNNGKGKMTDEDPNITLIKALGTLIEIINHCKSEKEKAFELASKFQNLNQVKRLTEFFAVLFLSHH